MNIIKKYYPLISIVSLVLFALIGALRSTPMLPSVEIEFPAKDKIYNSYRPKPKTFIPVPVPVDPKIKNI